jgi:MOSC domain-containing protein
MPDLRLASLHASPTKSCGGLSPADWDVDDFGLRYDRRWMVVTPAGDFITQREQPRLALVRPELSDGSLVLRAPGMSEAALPLVPINRERMKVQVWGDITEGVPVSPEAAQWLSRFLGELVQLVWMPDDVIRQTDPDYALGHRVSYADGFGFLLIGEASLTELNRRLEKPLPMNRFRPNLVVSGSEPFAEDQWRELRLGALELTVVKPCARCVTTTTNQDTAERGVEPLRTLATFRKRNGQVMFGQNLVHRGTGRLAVGAPVQVVS